MAEPLNEVRNQTCPSCEGNGSDIGKIFKGDGNPQWGVRECKLCKGTGKAPEAKCQEYREFMESIQGDPDEGEEWKRGSAC
jgi:hypothetical protein